MDVQWIFRERIGYSTYRRLERSEERAHWGRPAGDLATSDAGGRVGRDRIEGAALSKDIEDGVAIERTATRQTADDGSRSNKERQERAEHPGERGAARGKSLDLGSTRQPSVVEETFCLYMPVGISSGDKPIRRHRHSRWYFNGAFDRAKGRMGGRIASPILPRDIQLAPKTSTVGPSLEGTEICVACRSFSGPALTRV
jgi:hypothetical protein